MSSDIAGALDRAGRRASRRRITADDRYVIFSDLHKGARDGADDFQRCERSYNAALAYYNELGYHLVELGDVEELWESSFKRIAPAYLRTFELAAAFHPGRYTRVWGNHDLGWKDVKQFQRMMAEFEHDGAFPLREYATVTPVEALWLAVDDGAGGTLGELLLLHGHQGTADSDRHAWRSSLLVRHAWGPLQRLLNHPSTTPSVDWALRGAHAREMSTWASRNRVVLIAGHTHKPVFFGSAKKAETPRPAAGSDGNGEGAVERARALARTEWATAEAARLERQPPFELETPSYFNTGCCSFGDGDITGIEVADGEIRLVRWPCDPAVDRQRLAAMTLSKVFELVGSSSSRAAIAPPVASPTP